MRNKKINIILNILGWGNIIAGSVFCYIRYNYYTTEFDFYQWVFCITVAIGTLTIYSKTLWNKN